MLSTVIPLAEPHVLIYSNVFMTGLCICKIAAYIDFSKAFDVVSHNKLFVRLESYGISGASLS